MGTNDTTTKATNHSATRVQSVSEEHIRNCVDFQRLRTLVGPTRLGLQKDLDPYAYMHIVDGLQRFYANRYAWVTMPGIIAKHLAFTVFVPGGRADKAREAVDLMDVAGYFQAPYDTPEDEARKIISTRVRFPNQKAKRFFEALAQFDRIRDNLPTISGYLNRRDWLENNVGGFGPKAATHFMRNTGLMHYSDGLPIIDVHINKVLKELNFQHDTYATASESFQRLSELIDVPVLLTDAILWCAYADNWDTTGADFDNFGIHVQLDNQEGQ